MKDIAPWFKRYLISLVLLKTDNWWALLHWTHFAGTSRVGDKEWVCDFPEGKRICTLQGDTISSTHKSNPQLCKGIGADCVSQKMRFPLDDCASKLCSGYSWNWYLLMSLFKFLIREPRIWRRGRWCYDDHLFYFYSFYYQAFLSMPSIHFIWFCVMFKICISFIFN